jgi:hypothetical protein
VFVVQEAEPSALDIRETLQLSFNLVRRDWPWIVLLFVALGVAPAIGSIVFLHSGYRSGSHDLRTFAIYAGEAVALSLLAYFWPLTITALGVESRGERSPSKAFAIALASVPTLLPLWVFTHSQMVFRLWMAWTHWRPAGPLPGAKLASVVLWVGLLEIITNMLVLVGAGIVSAVVVGERRGTVGSLSRAWRLMSGSRWRLVALSFLIKAGAFVADLIWPLWRAALRSSHAGAAIPAGDWAIFGLGRGVDAIWAIVLAAAYLELRRAREGVVEGDVAQIFA